MRIIGLLLLLGLTAARAAEPVSESVASLLEYARSDYAAEHFEAALDRLEQCDKAGGPTGESLDLRAAILLEQGKLEAAKRAAEKSLEVQPELFAPRLHLADILLREKKYTEARTLYEKLGRETKVLILNERVRYGILLSALGLHDEAGAKSALANIRFPTETGAYYFAQAAAEFATGETRSANKWIATAGEIFDAASLACFARPLYDFGWLKEKPPPPAL